MLIHQHLSFTGAGRVSQRTGGPKADREVTDLINQIANENPLWGICLFKTSSVLKMTKFCSN
jgi:hypothetical protein